jgi:hypothetical protein
MNFIIINRRSLPAALITALLLLAGGLTACGDKSSSQKAGEAAIAVNPASIGAGERTEVEVTVTDTHPSGVALKILIPSGLTYIPYSSRLVVEEKDEKVKPTVNQMGAGGSYLVYYIPHENFGARNRGVLTFELRAAQALSDESITVDLDIDDPSIDNQSEFDPKNPKFKTLDVARIAVR